MAETPEETRMIEFYLKALDLKDEKRTGWELRNIEQPESVASHSWGAAMLCLMLAEKEELDRQKCVEMALIHDLAEAETGDFATRDIDGKKEVEAEEKEELELAAIKELTEGLDSDKINKLWQEYEDRETPEAEFVKDMDLVDMCLQALKYEKDERYDPEEENENFQEYDNLDEFFATSEPRLNTETGKDLFAEIKQRYEEAKRSK